MHKTLHSLLKKMSSSELTGTNIINWSSPIPSFGDISISKVATLGLNPSNKEFVDNNGDELIGLNRRFHTLNSLGLSDWGNANQNHIKLITKTCNEYFKNNPYDGWFNSLDNIISGLKASYYETENNACHLDLVPIATKCKWGALSEEQRKLLLSFTGDYLATLLHHSPIRVLILNGMSVINNLKTISSINFKKTEMPSWVLPRKSNRHIKGYSFRGELHDLCGIKFKQKILVLGYNHNIQSSFGVTNTVKKSIRTWITKHAKGALT